MRANELELLRASGIEPCLLMDNGGKTGRLLFSEAALALRPGVNMLENARWTLPSTIINQRASETYTANSQGVYGIDRWRMNGAAYTITISNTSLRLSVPSDNTGAYFTQRLVAGEYGLTPGTELTLSFYLNMVSSSSGNVKIGCYDEIASSFQHKICPIEAGKQVVSYTFTLPGSIARANVLSVFLCVDNGDFTGDLYAAKLEIGSIQTIAHQDSTRNWVLNDPTPNKVLELLKCQNYLRIVHPSKIVGVGHRTAQDDAWYCMSHGTPMRAIPTIVQNGCIVSYGSDINRDVGLLSIGQMNTDGDIYLLCYNFEGITDLSTINDRVVSVSYLSPAPLILSSEL